MSTVVSTGSQEKKTGGTPVLQLLIIALVVFALWPTGSRRGEPTPADIVDKAAFDWEAGTRRVFLETARWLESDESITDTAARDKLREELQAMTATATAPVMAQLAKSVVTDDAGKPTWSRERMIEILEALGHE